MFLLKCLHEMTRALVLERLLPGLVSRRFCGCCWRHAWHGVLGPAAGMGWLGAAGARFVWIWGEEFISREAEMLQNLVIYPSNS